MGLLPKRNSSPSQLAVALFAALLPSAALAAPPVPGFARAERSIPASEARQGVASDGRHVYVVDNSRIGKYAIATGERLGEFSGDPQAFPHLNSCTVRQGELVCAASNYPQVPQRGTAEFFDAASLRHLRSLPLPENPGSLTALAWRDGQWWASFAHYDGKGGVAGKDHSATLIARLDENFVPVRTWTLPGSVLARIAPRSISGMSWGSDGLLYASGHDKPEIYVLALPESGDVLRHEGTVAVTSFGQAIDFDPLDAGLLWSIDRASRKVIASRMPEPVQAGAGK